jgi:3-oxoacyl-[acyl-carrier protein] reductase
MSSPHRRGMLDERAALSGLIAVVLGGAGGLGRAIAEDLARCGVAVAVGDRDAVALAAIDEDLRRLGAPVLSQRFDARDADAMAEFFDAVDERFERLDILVNVPGGGFWAELAEIRPRGVDAVVAQNFGYVLGATQHAARLMRRGGRGGSIVNLTTIEAHRAMPGMAVYGAMKAAVTHLTATLAVELGRWDVRVNAVAPDMVPTPATRAAGWSYDDETGPHATLDNAISIPLGRKGNVEEVSSCVLFLASRLSSYVTGTTIHVDGGTHASSGWLRWPSGYRPTVAPDVVEALLDDPAASPAAPNPTVEPQGEPGP